MKPRFGAVLCVMALCSLTEAAMAAPCLVTRVILRDVDVRGCEPLTEANAASLLRADPASRAAFPGEAAALQKSGVVLLRGTERANRAIELGPPGERKAGEWSGGGEEPVLFAVAAGSSELCSPGTHIAATVLACECDTLPHKGTCILDDRRIVRVVPPDLVDYAAR